MIDWTKQAVRHLEQAHDYIALANSADVAEEIALRILASVEQLAAFPLSGRPGRVPGTRELEISNTPFIAAYKAEQSRIADDGELEA